jgi:hypothetical protein
MLSIGFYCMTVTTSVDGCCCAMVSVKVLVVKVMIFCCSFCYSSYSSPIKEGMNLIGCCFVVLSVAVYFKE